MIRAVRPQLASVGHASDHREFVTCQVRPLAEAGFAGELRSFSLVTEDITMAPAFKVMLDQARISGVGWQLHRFSTSVNPWNLFATQFGTFVIMPGDEGPEDHAENEFLQGLSPLSSSTSEASTIASTPRDHARYDLRGRLYRRGSSP